MKRNVMADYAWETIDSFQNYQDFENFLIWIEEQIQLGQAEDVPVQ